MKLSVVIPAHNEDGCIESTVRGLHDALLRADITHEILIINDHSTDTTGPVAARLAREILEVRYLTNSYSAGFGLAVSCGLEHFTGDAVAIYMADASDGPADLIQFFRKLANNDLD